jgi:Ca2+/H+ antiporter, TMEM165/GDT1 family
VGLHPSILATVFGLVFLGELPDKTMFASLVLSARGRPFMVWIGAAVAFLIHVVIAVSVGVAIFDLVPHRVVEALTALLFIGTAVYAWRAREDEEEELEVAEAITRRRTVFTAAAVIFVAEWGDLTQIITANLALRYHSPLSVGLGALVALWAVAGLAVLVGPRLLSVLSARQARVVGAAVLLALGLLTGVQAVLK